MSGWRVRHAVGALGSDNVETQFRHGFEGNDGVRDTYVEGVEVGSST